MLTLALITLATSLLVAGVLWAETYFRGYYADNALLWAQDAYDNWRFERSQRKLEADEQRFLEAAE